jgi:hypothetical protein
MRAVRMSRRWQGDSLLLRGWQETASIQSMNMSRCWQGGAQHTPGRRHIFAVWLGK